MELDKNIFISQPAAAEAHRLNLRRRTSGAEDSGGGAWLPNPLEAGQVCKKKNGF